MKLKYNNITVRESSVNDAVYLHKYWNESGWTISLDEVKASIIKESNSIVYQYMIDAGEKTVGDIHYGNVDNKGAEIGVYIRDDNEKSKGYGTTAMIMLIDVLLNRLGYDRIVFNTNVDNKCMRHIAENKFGLTPVIHENILQEQSGTYESYAEYELKKEMWQNKIDYEIL